MKALRLVPSRERSVGPEVSRCRNRQFNGSWIHQPPVIPAAGGRISPTLLGFTARFGRNRGDLSTYGKAYRNVCSAFRKSSSYQVFLHEGDGTRTRNDRRIDSPRIADSNSQLRKALTPNSDFGRSGLTSEEGITDSMRGRVDGCVGRGDQRIRLGEAQIADASKCAGLVMNA